jgi:hypothetical protein
MSYDLRLVAKLTIFWPLCLLHTRSLAIFFLIGSGQNAPGARIKYVWQVKAVVQAVDNDQLISAIVLDRDDGDCSLDLHRRRSLFSPAPWNAPPPRPVQLRGTTSSTLLCATYTRQRNIYTHSKIVAVSDTRHSPHDKAIDGKHVLCCVLRYIHTANFCHVPNSTLDKK